MSSFEKAWAVAKNERFGEKFNEKLRRMKEGARPVPEKFSDLRSTTPERDNFDNEPPTHSAPNALGSRGLIDRARKAGKIVKEVDFENIRRGEPCYACHMDNTPEMCKGATHSYHGGAGGLFTYCKPQLNKIMQDPTISGDDLSWIDDIQEM